jgi:hypothetical protein
MVHSVPTLVSQALSNCLSSPASPPLLPRHMQNDHYNKRMRHHTLGEKMLKNSISSPGQQEASKKQGRNQGETRERPAKGHGEANERPARGQERRYRRCVCLGYQVRELCVLINHTISITTHTLEASRTSPPDPRGGMQGGGFQRVLVSRSELVKRQVFTTFSSMTHRICCTCLHQRADTPSLYDTCM